MNDQQLEDIQARMISFEKSTDDRLSKLEISNAVTNTKMNLLTWLGGAIFTVTITTLALILVHSF